MKTTKAHERKLGTNKPPTLADALCAGQTCNPATPPCRRCSHLSALIDNSFTRHRRNKIPESHLYLYGSKCIWERQFGQRSPSSCCSRFPASARLPVCQCRRLIADFSSSTTSISIRHTTFFRDGSKIILMIRSAPLLMLPACSFP